MGHTRKNSRGGLVRYDRQTPRWAGSVKELGLRRLPFLAADPNLLEKMVETDLVVGGNGCAAVHRVGERTIERMARTMLRRVEVQVAMIELDAAVGLAPAVPGVPHHQDVVAAGLRF